jgi:hypothetical protein
LLLVHLLHNGSEPVVNEMIVVVRDL